MVGIRERVVQPSVSVIIVNWNGEKWLDRCLGSLKNQVYPDYQVVVVDNGSTDGSLELMKSSYPEVAVIENPKNSGFAGGNNLGVAAATGELILFLNSDTWVNSNFIKGLVKRYQESGCDVVGPVEADYEGKALLDDVWSIDVLGHTIHVHNPSKQFFLSGVSLLFSKDLYLSTGGLDEDFFMYFEEVDWFWRLNLQAKKYCIAQEVVVYHAGSGSTGSGVKYNIFLWRNQNTLQMLLKNYSALMLLLILPVYLIQNILEALFFLLTGKFSISKTYLLGWTYNLSALKRTFAKRKIVQSLRKLSDHQIMRKMFHGPAKLYHLLIFLGIKKEYGKTN